MIRKLTVLYDGGCGLCARCRAWLESQPALIPMEFLAYQEALASGVWPGLEALHPERELVVVDDANGVYQGADAWLMCLYALEGYREWSFRLAHPLLKPRVESVVAAVAERRIELSRWFRLDTEMLARAFGHLVGPACILAVRTERGNP